MLTRATSEANIHLSLEAPIIGLLKTSHRALSSLPNDSPDQEVTSSSSHSSSFYSIYSEDPFTDVLDNNNDDRDGIVVVNIGLLDFRSCKGKSSQKTSSALCHFQDLPQTFPSISTSLESKDVEDPSHLSSKKSEPLSCQNKLYSLTLKNCSVFTETSFTQWRENVTHGIYQASPDKPCSIQLPPDNSGSSLSKPINSSLYPFVSPFSITLDIFYHDTPILKLTHDSQLSSPTISQFASSISSSSDIPILTASQTHSISQLSNSLTHPVPQYWPLCVPFPSLASVSHTNSSALLSEISPCVSMFVPRYTAIGSLPHINIHIGGQHPKILAALLFKLLYLVNVSDEIRKREEELKEEEEREVGKLMGSAKQKETSPVNLNNWLSTFLSAPHIPHISYYLPNFELRLRIQKFSGHLKHFPLHIIQRDYARYLTKSVNASSHLNQSFLSARRDTSSELNDVFDTELEEVSIDFISRFYIFFF
jgi:hypothetical protein